MNESHIQRDRADANSKYPLFALPVEANDLRRHFDLWRKFHFANPRIWSLYQMFAYQALDAGHSRYSSDAILHRIRWHVTVETKDESGFKINNNHSSYYSRLFAQMYPNITLFETRTLASGEDEAWLDYEMAEIAHLSSKEFSR